MTQPAETFPVTIESAWHALMKQLARKNITHANAQATAANRVRQIMRRG